MLVDSHCHLHDRQFFTTEEAEAALARAHATGIEKIICIGTDPADSLAARDFATTHDNVYWTYGVHPSEWKKWDHTIFSDLPCAIGEVGLDYHYGRDDREQQIKLFEQMLELATVHNLPVSFHIREAFDDFFAVIANFPQIKGVVHSFTDSKQNLRRILDQTDFYIGVNGLATYSTLPTPPLDRTLLETDAPFLAPIPYRGTTNEPAYIHDIATWLATKLGTTLDDVATTTTANTHRLFNI